MGNILNPKPDINLIRHLSNFHIKILNENEHRDLERFKFKVQSKEHDVSLFTTYEYQKIDHYFATNFMLCKSSSVDEVIKNVLLGEESIAHFFWDYREEKDIFHIKDILQKPTISCSKINLVEIHSNMTSKSCITLRNHHYLKNQDNRKYFSENDIIDGIISNFVTYPKYKILLLTVLLSNNNIIDIRLNILNLYIRMLYVF